MKNNNTRERYRSITTLEELRREREKLRWQTASVEDNLAREYHELCGMFTLANITRLAFEKIDNVRSIILGVRDGYNSISSLFGRKHKKDE